MKSKKTTTLIFLAVTLVLTVWSADLKAQPYEHSGGIRAGYSSGISYKGFRRHKMAAIEADILYNRHGFNLSALYEHHMEPFRNKKVLIYLGGGAFGGDWDEEFSMGVVAAAGIEYNTRDLPLNFGLDWRPMLNVYRIFAPDLLDFGISVRYRFGR
ncbi:MAG: hypothetical protein KAR16_00685 [Bacteroidales bacterium]|nr:hypothetical protein [Bacteroidales bacterium]